MSVSSTPGGDLPTVMIPPFSWFIRECREEIEGKGALVYLEGATAFSIGGKGVRNFSSPFGIESRSSSGSQSGIKGQSSRRAGQPGVGVERSATIEAVSNGLQLRVRFWPVHQDGPGPGWLS